MKRLFTLSSLLALAIGVTFSFGLAGPSPDEPQGPKKLVPPTEEKKETAPPGQLEPPAPKDPGKDHPKLEPPPGKINKDKPEDPKEVIARVQKNMETSEDHLKKGKTGSDTQTVQKKIIDDLDKLINQQKKSSQSDSESQKKKSQSQNNSGGAGSQEKPDPQNQPDPKTDKSNTGKSNTGKPNDKTGGSSDNSGQGTTGKKDDPKNTKPMLEPKEKDDKDKTGKAQMTDGKNSKDSDTTVADIFKQNNPWGYLPKQKRQEMETYSHEQFLPQYEQLLRQYYQNIAAQGKKQGGD